MMKKLVACVAITLSVCAVASAAIPESERNALLAIYNGNNGPAWTFKQGWNGAPGTECTWSGVRCDDAQTTVMQLNLAWIGLSGAFPASAIAALPNLEDLDLSGNGLTGQFPVELSTLPRLKAINLEYSALTGPIPSFIGSMTGLTSLDLYSNRLTGPIPPEIGNLVQLQTLKLGWNQLSGPIPADLARLSALTELDLDTNAFTGQIPVALTQLHNLQSLSLSINQLTGPIPHEIGNLSQLTELLIAYNQLSGPIPDELYTLRQLKNLGLEGNQLTGPISPAIGNLTALTQLDLNTNQFSGPIPAEINSLPALSEFNIQENKLTGQIPAKLDGLTSLVTLDLGSNQLTGPVPASIASLSKLENLALYDNHLGGTVPDSLRNLSNLKNLNLALDDLSGPVPDWVFQFPNLDSLYLSYNALTGPLPSTISSAVNIEYLDLSGNQITGQIPADIGSLQKVVNFWLAGNELSGPIPDSLWTIPTLDYLDLSSNQLTGSLPAAIANLKKLRVLFVKDNRLSGPLPPEIGSLANLDLLDLGMNEFSGTLPPELGQLKKLESVDFGANNFRSPVPPEIMNMTGLLDTAVDFSYNALTVTDPALVAFMNRVQFDHDFQKSQTVLPANIALGQVTDRSAVLSWTPIQYWWDEGGYRVFASLTPDGPPVAVATTASKEIESLTIRGLQPSTTYYFTVATVSHPHDFQHNLIVSDLSAPIQATTMPRQLAPADVVLTATPTGLVELDGVPQNEDSFTLTNFGDAPTAITLGYEHAFFEAAPTQFTLAGGASQVVKVTAIPNQPVGFYYSGVIPTGDGTSEDDIVTTTMLSAKRSGGVAIAEPATNRIEIASPAGIDPVGQVTFRNRGTAMLVGVLVSDQPWLVPNNTPIMIEAGTSATVGFKIVRARRPSGIINGALTGTLSLVYVGQLPEGLSDVHASDTTPPPSVSISKVTVVDVSKPDVSAASAPGLAPGEVAYYAVGLLNRSGVGSSLASGLNIVNAFGSKSISDVRLYYSSASEKAVATLSALGSAQGVSLANVVSNVYNPADQIGSVQVRSADWENLLVNANFLRSTGSGTLLGDLPVFRSDRALTGSDKLYLTGIAQPPNVHAALVLQEISGNAATLPVDFLDATGSVAQHRDLQVAALGTSEVSDVPPATATIVISGSGSAAVLAYVRMSDDSSGDTWSIVDWSRAYKYKRDGAVRLPLVMRSSGSGKRRAVKQSDAVTVRATTSASLFNTGSTDARARITEGSVSKDVTIPVGQTVTLSDVGSFVGATSSGSVVIEPKSGELVVTSRISSGGTGTSVPVVPAQNGLRVGQSQVFSGLEDSAAYRTDYGFVETGGASTTIRATLLLSDAHSLFSTVVTRDFRLDPNGFVYVPELVKSVLGDARSNYGDLHNLQLQLDVVDGAGSILPFVTTTDNATGDTMLRIE